MSACCQSTCHSPQPDPRFRQVLWIALAINAAMFAVELGAGVTADSTALLADAADFLGDAANYAVSLFVLALAPIWRSRAALAKGISMGAYGLGVLALAVYHAIRGSSPDPMTMGVIGFLALGANLSVAVLLYRFRAGDSNMRSVWLCTRNDAIGNVAVLLAAAGVFGTGSAWPDLIVASIMALLGLSAAVAVIAQARSELDGKQAHRWAAFNAALADARRLRAAGEMQNAYRQLERAHLLGQDRTVPHVRSHWAFLQWAWHAKSGKETRGQLMRLAAALLVTWAWVPAGNTGGANVSPISSLPIPEDIARLLDRNTR